MSADGQLVEGIAIVGTKTGFAVSMGDEQRPLHVPLGSSEPHGYHVYPTYDGQRVRAAAPGKGGTKRLVGKGRWHGALLRVASHGLNLQGVGTHLHVRNAWVGIESIEPVYCQVGSRRDADQDQLAAIETGTTVFVCDHLCYYVEESCVDGTLAVRPARAEVLADHLVARATRTAFTHEALLWTHHTLGANDQLGRWSAELAERMDALEKKRRNVRVST